MSWAIVGRVQKTKVGSPSGKAVLLALANYCNEEAKAASLVKRPFSKSPNYQKIPSSAKSRR